MKKITHKILSAALGLSMIFQSAAIVRAADTEIVLATDKATTINATAADTKSANFDVRGGGTHLQICEHSSPCGGNGCKDPASLTVKFNVAEKQKFNLSVYAVADITWNENCSDLDFILDQNSEVTFTAANSTVGEEAAYGDWGIKCKKISYGTPLELSAGEHTLTFEFDKVTMGDKYRGAIGDIVLTPRFADNSCGGQGDDL